MVVTPAQILWIWLRGLLSVALLGLGIYLLYEWYRQSHVLETPAPTAVATQPAAATAPPPARRVFRPRIGFNAPTALLAGGAALLLLSFVGGRVVLLFSPRGVDDPTHAREGTPRRVQRPDGTEINVEVYGPDNGPPVVLTHGWGADAAEWYYARRELGAVYRLIAWDLPGLGRSAQPANNDYSLEKLADDLDAVIGLAGGTPVVLLGHSIGGMINLTYCKRFPEALGTRVAGLVQVHTTYTNPVKTHSKAPLYTALQKPVLEPLAHLMIWLSPLVRAMVWLSYLNGTTHLSVRRSGFAGTQTRGQLDWAARFAVKAPPDVLARGTLGMFRYDATGVLGAVNVPTLVIAGDRDPTCKPEASKFMRDHILGAELLTLAPAKHMGLIEHHGQFAEAVAAFVSRRPAAVAGGANGAGGAGM